MKGYLHWIVPSNDFRLLTPEGDLATYRFNTKKAEHQFCPVCGVSSFYIARSDPEKIDINVRCIEGIDPESLDRELFDGENWEQAFEDYKS